MNRSNFVLFIVIFIILFCCSTTYAWGDDDNRIPNGSVYSCWACHYPNNQFYHDYNNQNDTWTYSLSQMDSDGDGYTNGEELLDPDGHWEIGNPDPGNPNDVTNPGDSGSHPEKPTATPTSTPTQESDTPTPTPTEPGAETPTPTPEGDTPTPTPDGCYETGVRINMPSNYFQPGDPFYCKAIICNAEGSEISGKPLFVILAIQGNYYFAPSFGSYDSFSMNFPVGDTTVDVLNEFAWPSGVGTMSDVNWYGALTDSSVTTLFGTLGVYTFGWGN